jgi:hypothetical protein
MLTRFATLVLVFGLTLAAERAEAQTAKPTSEQKTPVATPQEPRQTPWDATLPVGHDRFSQGHPERNYQRATEYLDSKIKLPERRSWLGSSASFWIVSCRPL